jgi:parvulin-like peptidyl-prolyl isomerase
VLAIQYSDDPSAKQNKGDLGWFADGTMVPEFNEAVLNGKVGDLVTVESPFGYHVIKITGKKDPVKKVRIAMVDRAVEPSSKTFQDIYAAASSFAGENNTKAKFDKTCNEKGLDKRSAPYLQAMTNNIAGIENPRELVRWAYYDGIEEGEVSGVFDVGGAYVVACLTAIREKGTIPLVQIKDNLKNFVLNDKKAAYIIDQIGSEKDIYTIARNNSTKVDTNITLTFSSRNIPGYGAEFQVIGNVFAMNEGQVSEPVKGNAGVFVVALDRFYNPPDPGTYTANQTTMLMSFRSRVSQGTAVYNALEKKAEITDNRKDYF